MRPDPCQESPPDDDLPHAFHGRPELRRFRQQPTLDSEKIPPIFRSRYRRDLGDFKREQVRRQRRQQEITGLSNGDVPNIVFVDFEDNPVRIERGHLKQHFPFFHRRTQLLTQITGYHDTGERCRDLGSGQFLGGKVELGLDLSQLSIENFRLRSIPFSEGLALFLGQLFALVEMLEAFQLQVTILEGS